MWIRERQLTLVLAIPLKVSRTHFLGKWCCLHGEMQQCSDWCLSHHGAVFDYFLPPSRKEPSLKVIPLFQEKKNHDKAILLKTHLVLSTQTNILLKALLNAVHCLSSNTHWFFAIYWKGWAAEQVFSSKEFVTNLLYPFTLEGKP